jgi:hypothetical protein
MQQRAERAVDQRGRIVDFEVAHVALAQLELDAGVCRVRARLCEHRRRRVDAEHAPADRLRDGNRDPAVADGELDHRPGGLTREPDVERDVGGHRGRPLLVAVCERLVPAHPRMLRTQPKERIALRRGHRQSHAHA